MGSSEHGKIGNQAEQLADFAAMCLQSAKECSLAHIHVVQKDSQLILSACMMQEQRLAVKSLHMDQQCHP